MSVLDDGKIRGLLLRAWRDSQPGTSAAHEEGGFVLQNDDGSLDIERWPRGGQNQIVVPAHAGGKFDGRVILAIFHTHPNPGPQFEQQPSLTDIRAVRADPELGHGEYEGEYVIASENVYRIDRSGRVETVGETKTLLSSYPS